MELPYDDDTPLLNIDPEQSLDPTPNDPLTSTVPFPTVPSPTNSQSSHASLPNIVVPYKTEEILHCTTTIETTPLNMLANSKGVYMAVAGVSYELVPENRSRKRRMNSEAQR